MPHSSDCCARRAARSVERVAHPRGPVERESVKDLFAAYRQGTIQVNLTAPGSVAQSRLVALMQLVAR